MRPGSCGRCGEAGAPALLMQGLAWLPRREEDTSWHPSLHGARDELSVSAK